MEDKVHARRLYSNHGSYLLTIPKIIVERLQARIGQTIFFVPTDDGVLMTTSPDSGPKESISKQLTKILNEGERRGVQDQSSKRTSAKSNLERFRIR